MKAPARALLMALLGLCCVSRSPFATSPAEVAKAEPCRYMGTVHKESRQRIEVLRACGTVSHEAWLCMAHALRALDVEFTGRCRTGPVRLREIVVRQRVLYAPCVPVAATETLDCALLDADDDCLVRDCPLSGSRPLTEPGTSAEARRRAPARCAA